MAAFLGAFGIASAQEPLPPTPTPATTAEAPAEEEKKEAVPFRPMESNVIVVLPSVDVAPKGTLQFLVTHRFTTPIQDGNIDNWFTLDNGNEWGFGLWYSPLKNLSVGAFRTSTEQNFDVYEASAQYEFPRCGGFAAALRSGADVRTDEGAQPQTASFFAQAILSYTFGKYVRVTAIPTYLQSTNGGLYNYPDGSPPPHDRSCRQLGTGQFFQCSGYYHPVWNVPVAASVAVTHSITVHGEVYPRFSRYDSAGVGWTVSVEKSLLRHRFAFYAGNQRYTTVDQYTPSIHPNQNPGNVYIGFNLYRAWKLE